jgi:signal transduction histidine kinase
VAGFVVRLECAGYRTFVTPRDQSSTHRPARATADVVIALTLGVPGWIVVVVLPVLVWYWPVWRLLYGNDQYGFLGSWPITPVLLIVAAALTLFGWPALIRAVTTAHRLRLVHLLGVSVPPPPRPEGPLRTVAWRELLSAATWRQFVYHLAAPVAAATATVAVLAAWLVAYPRAAGFAVALAELDAAAARMLLGPSQHEQLARQVAELTRSRSAVIAATDAERRRIERDLHDGAQQRLVSLAMKLGLTRTSMTDAPDSVRNAVAEAHEEAKIALTELRSLVRGLHPPVLEDRGLDAALSGLCAIAPIPVQLRVRVPQRCPPVVEAVAYFVVAEALTNVARHARADRAEVVVEWLAHGLHIVVSDDGRGGARPGVGTGLVGLTQRVAAVEGTLSIESPTGGPTRITVDLPCAL